MLLIHPKIFLKKAKSHFLSVKFVETMADELEKVVPIYVDKSRIETLSRDQKANLLDGRNW